MHQNIYGAGGNIKAGTNIFTLGSILAAPSDLSQQQPGAIIYYQFAFFAGGGIKGGDVIGSTHALGATPVNPGWSRQRLRMSKPPSTRAMGINCTNIRYDDPFGCGFEYVPNAASDTYGPI